MVLTCSVVTCRNNSDKVKKWRQGYCFGCDAPRLSHRCNCASPYKLKTFPTTRADKDARHKWKVLINRTTGNGKLWSPKKDARVCSLHFVDGRPTQEHPYPTLLLGYEEAEKKAKRMLFSDLVNSPQPKRKRVDPTPDVQPATQPDNNPEPDSTTFLDQDPVIPDPPVPNFLPPTPSSVVNCHWTAFTSFLIVVQFLWMLAFRYHSQISQLCQRVKVLTQLLAEEKRRVNRLLQQVEKLKATAKEDSLSKTLLKTDEDVNFFTGIRSRKLFQELLTFVAPYIQRRWRGSVSLVKNVRKFIGKQGPQRQLSNSDEFLLTLMKLRLGLLNKDLASRFKISASLCSTIFFSWLRGLTNVLGPVVFMPDKEEVAASKPARFRHLPDIHSIIDCTEVFIETPKDLLVQAATWSDYKHHNTLKILVAVSPNSNIVFTSKAYGGRAGDKAITLDCEFLDAVPPYSMIMADKGFNIAKECADRFLSLHVPPGRRGQSQMTSAAVRKTKRIANLRILVEQVIRQLKTFRILNTELPITLVPHIDNIVTVCSALVNWGKSIYSS